MRACPWFEDLPEGPKGLPEGPEGLSEGSEGLSEASEGLPEGLPEGPRACQTVLGARQKYLRACQELRGKNTNIQMYGCMDGQMYRISPYSTALHPLLGLLPQKNKADCYKSHAPTDRPNNRWTNQPRKQLI